MGQTFYSHVPNMCICDICVSVEVCQDHLVQKLKSYQLLAGNVSEYDLKE